MNIPLDQPLLIILAFATAIMGVGRLSRVITYDDYPPTVWLRLQWVKLTKGNGWSKLATCQWCFTPWLMASCIAWGWFSDLHWTWFAFWGWLALSYLASIVIARDEPE